MIIDTSKHLTTDQLAERWKMNTGTLRNWRSKKRGPKYIALGAGKRPAILYALKDIKSFEKNWTKPSSE